MKYNEAERLEIGKQIYKKELILAMAAVKYGISMYTARDYYRLYKAKVELKNKVKK